MNSGDSQVGKTCLATRFVRNSFFEREKGTVGGDFLPIILAILFLKFCFIAAYQSKTVTVDDTTFIYEIWDTAGQGILVCVVVYDLIIFQKFLIVLSRYITARPPPLL